MRKLKIAVIGSGISGLSASWKLSKYHNIHLFEKNNYYGGHANTLKVKLEEKSFYVDTGFIVFNHINYPNLCNLFNELGVRTYESDMSFSASLENRALEYSGSSLGSMFAQKKNIFNFRYLKMLMEIIKFYKNVEYDIRNYNNCTIDDYLTIKNYSDFFKYKHIYPMASSIWSSSLNEIKKYPFEQFVNFFSNHGLLNIINRPKWRTVFNGSQTYVKKIIEKKNIIASKNIDIKIDRFKNGKLILKVNKKEKKYDHVIIAVHSDQVKQVNKIQNLNNIKVFEDIKYTTNEVFLHTDESLMPRLKKVWASWNYLEGENSNKLSVTYWMNKLQNLDTNKNIFVTLNPYMKPSKNKTIKRIIYDHPIYSLKTFKTQKKIRQIQGKNNIWYCGAYLGYGFHEDGIKSGLDVVTQILKKNK